VRDGFSREEARQVGARDVEGAQVRHGRQESGESGGRLVVVDGQEPVVVVCLGDVQVSAGEWLVYTNIFQRSIGKHAITTYNNHSRHLISDGIHVCFNEF